MKHLSTSKERHRKINDKRREYEKNKKTVYALTLEQCSPSPLYKLEGALSFENMEVNKDAVVLVRLIRGFCFKHNVN